MKVCTTMDDDLFLEARDAYEYEHGRWKKGSMKDLLEKSLKLFIEKHGLKRR